MAPPQFKDGRRTAELLTTHRAVLARALFATIEHWPKYAADIQAAGPGAMEFIERELFAFIDYLALYASTGDENFRHLYIGEKIKQLYIAGMTPDDRRQLTKTTLATDREHLVTTLTGLASAEEVAAVAGLLDAIAAILNRPTSHTVRVLLVGDCLYLDVLAFATAALLEDGIALDPTFITSKNPAERRRDIRRLENQTFSAVFYSPVSYEFSGPFAELLAPRSAAARRRTIHEKVGRCFSEVQSTLETLAAMFECGIFVHNTCAIRRADRSWKDGLKTALTSRTRRRAAEEFNRRLDAWMNAYNTASFEHVFLIDETELARRHGERALARLFYHSDLQHPAALGKYLAPLYRDIINVHADFLKRKLIVCDLDNTLWRGVIGEGAIVHHHDRQNALRALKQKGIVLAIDSKNDPKNVHFTGGTLTEKDFVSVQINWDSKVGNLRRIQADLNLNYKDYIFLDDRADERAMVQASFPDIKVTDPESPRTWQLLNLWARVAPKPDGGDRTLFYQQREQRNAFLQAQEQAEDPAAMFASLNLSLHIRPAAAADLKRAAELVNRTNQFNVRGSRTSVRDLAAWQENGGTILLADCADKFGAMGTVSVLTAGAADGALEIPIFVLSCRVFGYGIEMAVLNRVKRDAVARGLAGVRGLLVETPHNQPCRRVYQDNGFAAGDDGAWFWNASNAVPADPAWLQVRNG